MEAENRRQSQNFKNALEFYINKYRYKKKLKIHPLDKLPEDELVSENDFITMMLGE